MKRKEVSTYVPNWTSSLLRDGLIRTGTIVVRFKKSEEGANGEDISVLIQHGSLLGRTTTTTSTTPIPLFYRRIQSQSNGEREKNTPRQHKYLYKKNATNFPVTTYTTSTPSIYAFGTPSELCQCLSHGPHHRKIKPLNLAKADRRKPISLKTSVRTESGRLFRPSSFREKQRRTRRTSTCEDAGRA